MSVKVGIPCMKCSIHPSQIVNKKSGKKSRTCGVSSAWREMNDERLGRDETINKEMTYLNVWMEGSSDMDLIGRIEKEIDRINEERRSFGKRGLRNDAVSVIAIIEKPNIDFMKNLTYDQRVEFLNKSNQVMTELIHEWNPNWTILAAVQHHDEFGGLSAHNHKLVMVSTKDKDGISNMCAFKEFNLKFFNYINKNYPAKMRRLGLDVQDVRTFDQLNEQEKLERKLHPEEHGLDAYLYKQKKKEELEQDIKLLNVKKETLTDELEKTVVEITQAPNYASYKSVLNENESLKTELDLKDRIIEKLKEEVNSLKTKLESWKNRFTEISYKAGAKLMSLFGYDVHETVRNDLPQADILEKFNAMQNNMKEYDPSKMRVVPDKENNGRYSIIYKINGKYEVFENGLENRSIAESKIRELKLLEKKKQQIKYKKHKVL